MSSEQCPVKNIINIIDDERIFEKRQNLKSFEDGMKLYESHSFIKQIPKDRPFIIRLNANSYLNITKLLNTNNQKIKSFNKTYNIAMIKTAEALLNDMVFKPVSVYTQYDEIIIIFNGSSIIHKGDAQKYITTLSSKATNYFNQEFYKIFNHTIMNYYDDHTICLIQKNIPIFEGCVVFFPKDKEYEIMNYIIWRNSKNRDVIQDYSKLVVINSSLVKLKKNEQIDLYKSITGVDIEDQIPDYINYGVYLKKSIYSACYIPNQSESESEKKKIIDIVHPITHIWSMKIKYDNDIIDELLKKTYDNEKWQTIAKKNSTKVWHIYDDEELMYDTKIILKENTINHNDTNDTNDTNDVNDVNDDADDMDEESIIKFKQELATIPIIYKVIPFWAFHMTFVHIISILNNENISTILQNMIYYGLAYSVGIRFISMNFTNNKFNIHNDIMFGWIITFILSLLSPFTYLLEISKFFQLLSIVSVYYGYYFTVGNGIYLYLYITEKIKKYQLNQ
jgi:tRNA(His) 5'-end guanylyltransferase